jgi:hypothetical protein
LSQTGGEEVVSPKKSKKNNGSALHATSDFEDDIPADDDDAYEKMKKIAKS